MTTKTESLDQIIAGGDMVALRSFFQGTTDSERAALASKALTWYRKASKGGVKQSGNSYGWHWDLGLPVLRTSANAVVLCASAEQLAKLKWSIGFHNDIFDIDLLEQLHPPELENFGNILLDQDLSALKVVRELMHKGVCKKPDSDRYIIAMVGRSRMNLFRDGRTIMSLKEWITSSPDILNEDIWRFFEVEGDQENSLAAVDKYTPEDQGWTRTLIELSNEGHISRERLLCASLDALSRGFIQFRSGWYSRFHEDLKPTAQERAVLAEKYAQLLGSPIPPTVTFSVKALQQIDAHAPLDEDLLSKYLAPTLVARSKTTVSPALSLLEKACKRNKEFAPQACLMALDALQNEAADVQELVLKFLEKFGEPPDPLLSAKAESYVPSMSAKLAPRMNQWLAGTKSKSGQSGATNEQRQSAQLDVVNSKGETAFYTLINRQDPGWPLQCTEKITPIASVDELLDRAAYALEHPEDTDELERVLDAVARLSPNRDADFKTRTGPLAKRAFKIVDAHTWGKEVQTLFADFIHKWLTNVYGPNCQLVSRAREHSALTFMRCRLQSILDRIREGEYLPPLSAPTHAHGWLSCAALEERLKTWQAAGKIPDLHDMTMSVLRMPSDEREGLMEAISKPANAKGTLAAAFLNGVAAAVDFMRQPCPARSTLEFGFGTIFDSTDEYALIKWCAAGWPVLREYVMAQGARSTVTAIDWFLVDHRAYAAYMEVLTESGAPLGPKSLDLLAIGLILPDPETVGFARDALILAIEERRLDLEPFAQQINRWLHADSSKPTRLSKSLAEVARVSSVHTDAVRQIIEGTLSGDGTKAPKDIASLLELLVELEAKQRISLTNSAAKDYLKGIKTGGKTAKLVKQLLS